jgi:acylphosphatase
MAKVTAPLRGTFAIKGNVTDVDYRVFVLRKIISLGLKGFPCVAGRNKLEVRVEGGKGDITRLMKAVKKGAPLGVKVEKILAFKKVKGVHIPEPLSAVVVLQSEQVGKGISSTAQLKEDVRELRSSTEAGFKGAEKGRSALLKGVDGVNKSVEKFHTNANRTMESIGASLYEINANVKSLVYLVLAGIIIGVAIAAIYLVPRFA